MFGCDFLLLILFREYIIIFQEKSDDNYSPLLIGSCFVGIKLFSIFMNRHISLFQVSKLNW